MILVYSAVRWCIAVVVRFVDILLAVDVRSGNPTSAVTCYPVQCSVPLGEGSSGSVSSV